MKINFVFTDCRIKIIFLFARLYRLRGLHRTIGTVNGTLNSLHRTIGTVNRTQNGLHGMIGTVNGTLNGLHGTIRTENGMLNGLHGTIRTENSWNAFKIYISETLAVYYCHYYYLYIKTFIC
jgi:hypothetical protein